MLHVPVSLLLLLPVIASGQDVVGCGGFIQSTINMDFSKVEVKLYTKQGTHKYSTDCAPNGYFLIPIYDKGTFVIKVESSSGWSFRPESIEITVDGVTDPCSLGKDINFVFSGVSVSGRVVSQGQLVGPSGVSLSLIINEEVVVKGETTEGGQYHFPHILPGTYLLRASHPVWLFLLSEVNVTVHTDSVEVEGSIKLSGYDVTGKVQNVHGTREGAQLILISTDRTIIPGMTVDCEKQEISTDILEILFVADGEKPLCVATSDSNGVFKFKSLPTGFYRLYPYFKTAVNFEVKPSSLKFEVGHASVVLDTVFTVTGFTVYGQVLYSKNGKGIAQAEISVLKFGKTLTDSSGSFHLDGITPGMYTFDVVARDVLFETTEIEITPKDLHLPSVFPKKFSLCGNIAINSPLDKSSRINERSVFLSSTTGVVVHPTTAFCDAAGDFCFYVQPGDYIVKPVLTELETEYGLALAPSEIQISVTDQPVKGLKFSQFQAVLSGAVKCLSKEKCHKITVSLHGIKGSKSHTQALTSLDGKFVFQKVLPGKYEVSIVKDEWCWEKQIIVVVVSDKDVDDVLFVQSGYMMPYISSHAAVMHYQHSKDNKTSGLFDLAKGMGRLCLIKPGQYILTLESCHKFEQQKYSFDTHKPLVVQLSATQHQVSGTIIATEPVDGLKLSVSREDGDVQLTTVTTSKGSKIKGEKDLFVYHYTFLSTAGKIKVIPQFTDFLFKPPFRIVDVSIDDCTERVQPYHGSRGIYIEGKVSPPVSQVAIELVINDEVHVLKSDERGYYRYGPVDSETKHTVTASKDGYEIVPDEKFGDFKATKLGFISVRISNTDGQPLPGVLLSLTGLQYRNNSITGETGILTYTHLPPGQYFIKPLLKEYDFSPVSQSINIEKETESTLEITAKQVAFSCFGKVTSLGQSPEANIDVKALGMGDCSGHHEETSTNSDGHFRLRGLKPGCQFSIEVERDTEVQRIVRSIPEKEIISVTTEDVLDINIIVIRATGEFGLSGNVVTDVEYLQSLRVNLYEDGHQDVPVHTVVLGTSSFFYFPMLPADGRLYVLELESHLSTHTYSFSLPSQTFTTSGYHEHITFEFKPQLKGADVEAISKGPIIVALIVTLFAGFVLLNQAQFSDLLASLTDRLSGNGVFDRQNDEHLEARSRTTRKK